MKALQFAMATVGKLKAVGNQGIGNTAESSKKNETINVMKTITVLFEKHLVEKKNIY